MVSTWFVVAPITDGVVSRLVSVYKIGEVGISFMELSGGLGRWVDAVSTWFVVEPILGAIVSTSFAVYGIGEVDISSVELSGRL